MRAPGDKKSSPLVFLSHSSHDISSVQRVALELLEQGINVRFDEWKINAASRFVQKEQQNLNGCDYIFVWLTALAVKSSWIEKEWQLAYRKVIKLGKPKILPALAEKEIEFPALLRKFGFADFRESRESGLQDLLAALGRSRVRRVRPKKSPASVRASAAKFLRALGDLLGGSETDPN